MKLHTLKSCALPSLLHCIGEFPRFCLCRDAKSFGGAVVGEGFLALVLHLLQLLPASRSQSISQLLSLLAILLSAPSLSGPRKSLAPIFTSGALPWGKMLYPLPCGCPLVFSFSSCCSHTQHIELKHSFWGSRTSELRTSQRGGLISKSLKAEIVW